MVGFRNVELMPIAAPMSISVLIARGRSLHSLFSSFGLEPCRRAHRDTKRRKTRHAILQPGDPLSVQLITGDFDVGAIGTVTYRDRIRFSLSGTVSSITVRSTSPWPPPAFTVWFQACNLPLNSALRDPWLVRSARTCSPPYWELWETRYDDSSRSTCKTKRRSTHFSFQIADHNSFRRR